MPPRCFASRSKAFAIAMLLLSGQSMADGPRVVLEVREAKLVTTDGLFHEVNGGAYLDRDTLIDVAKETAALRAENQALKEAPVASPVLVVIACVLGVAAGFAAARLASN